ncbi:MAG: hypothetical protein D6808_07915 [Candidatus Dadabacteria bacterium]|nr:MAG: hypothetical protein D6808_07915 [Candidatus Dadabacteria bacterium]
MVESRNRPPKEAIFKRLDTGISSNLLCFSYECTPDKREDAAQPSIAGCWCEREWEVFLAMRGESAAWRSCRELAQRQTAFTELTR